MEGKREVAVQEKTPSPVVGFGNGKGLAPTDLAGAWKCAELVARSGLAPKGMEKPESILVAAAMGAEIGLSFMQSLQNIAVINGRPSLWGDALLALCEGTGELAEFDERIEGEGANMVAICRLVRIKANGHKRSAEERFSMADARLAGLDGKPGPWKQYPRRMLTMRARSFALRNAFADVLKGVRATEEVQDEIILGAGSAFEIIEDKTPQPAPSIEVAAPVAEVAAEPTPAPESEAKPKEKKTSVLCPPGGRKAGKMVALTTCPELCEIWEQCAVYNVTETLNNG